MGTINLGSTKANTLQKSLTPGTGKHIWEISMEAHSRAPTADAPTPIATSFLTQFWTVPVSGSVNASPPDPPPIYLHLTTVWEDCLSKLNMMWISFPNNWLAFLFTAITTFLHHLCEPWKVRTAFFWQHDSHEKLHSFPSISYHLPTRQRLSKEGVNFPGLFLFKASQSNVELTSDRIWVDS